MGASGFFTTAKGGTPREAFENACSDARYEYGHRGYTGTIAEKDHFVVIELPPNEKPSHYANKLVNEGDDRIRDKWGPAGCIALGGGSYLFFGFSSC